MLPWRELGRFVDCTVIEPVGVDVEQGKLDLLQHLGDPGIPVLGIPVIESLPVR